MDDINIVHAVELLAKLLPVIAFITLFMSEIIQRLQRALAFIIATQSEVQTLKDRLATLEGAVARLQVFQEQSPSGELAELELAELDAALTERGY